MPVQIPAGKLIGMYHGLDRHGHDDEIDAPGGKLPGEVDDGGSGIRAGFPPAVTRPVFPVDDEVEWALPA